MFLLWLLLALSMWSMLVTTKGRVEDNTLPFEFGLDAFIGRNCCKVLGPETLMIQVTLELVTPPCHSVNAKKSIHSVNPLTVTCCHSKNISATFFELFFFKDSTTTAAGLRWLWQSWWPPRDGGTSGSDDERERPWIAGCSTIFHSESESSESRARLSSPIETGGLQAVVLGPSWACELLLRGGYDIFLKVFFSCYVRHITSRRLFVPLSNQQNILCMKV